MYWPPVYVGPFGSGPGWFDPALFLSPAAYTWGFGPFAWGPCPTPFNPINFFF